MGYCKNCGVALDENIDLCPLCGLNPDEESPSFEKIMLKETENTKSYPRFDRLTKKQRLTFFWELSGIILLSTIIITSLIDFIINKSITWSKYSITVSLVLLVNTTLFTFLRKRQFIFLIFSFLSTALLLMLFDWYSQNNGWAIQLGIPLLFSFYFWVFLIAIITKYNKHHGLNILAYYFLATGFFTLCIDGIIAFYQTKVFQLQWSIIVFACLILISGILLYIHYRLKKEIFLKRFFHI
ncbi:MAG TPA: DUF6320 domain-containing protein [Bacteroidales bacterium]|nr:DUF6320 domain-containing protein [Bacteroidales bacterium]